MALEVPESTEEAVEEGVVVTSVQPTAKSFRVDRGDVVSLQAGDHWKNFAAQDSSEEFSGSAGREQSLCAFQLWEQHA